MRIALFLVLSLAACTPTDRSATAAPRDQSGTAIPAQAAQAQAAPRKPAPPKKAAMTPTLAPALETELDHIRNHPIDAVGFGEKSYIPYEPNGSTALQRDPSVATTERLLAEVQRSDADRVFKLAVLHVIGKRSDAKVDESLIAALGDPELRATAAYLLGRPGFKGYPARTRNLAAVRKALRPYLRDDTTFEDPFYRKAFRTQDFVIAAFVRLSGPENFAISDQKIATMIGYTLPRFTDDLRAALLARAESLP
ncbi:MAG TPA: hypothetical protein VFT22_43485 [Kofleriaceae bacterium]|nr:hypothetical protein [Kofleriaceae bacterium]